MALNGKHLLIGSAVVGAAYLLCKKKGVNGIGRILSPDYEVGDIRYMCSVYLYNDEECYRIMQWIVQALIKKYNRAERSSKYFIPSLQQLADSSSVKALCTRIIKLQGWHPARDEYAIIREQIAAEIIDNFLEQTGQTPGEGY